MTVLRIGFLVCLLGLSGCCAGGCLAKRESELNCPTDIRQTVPWCAGEDAIFHCPCGPNPNFYGYKPTCWSAWPADAAQWRDSQCSPQMNDPGCQMQDEDPTSLPIPVPSPAEQITPTPLSVRNVPPQRRRNATVPTPVPGPVREVASQQPFLREVGPERDTNDSFPTLPTPPSVRNVPPQQGRNVAFPAVPTPVPDPVREIASRPPFLRKVGSERNTNDSFSTPPTPAKGPVLDITPPPARAAQPERNTGDRPPKFTAPQQQPSGSPLAGGSPAESRPNFAANVPSVIFTGSLSQASLGARPRQVQPPWTSWRNEAADGLEDTSTVPGRLIVFERDIQGNR